MNDEIDSATTESPTRIEKESTKPAPIKIELRQLVGKFWNDKGKLTYVKQPLDIILVDGQEKAHVGHTPGVPVSVLRRVVLTTREIAAITAAITTKRGAPPSRFAFPPNVEPQDVADDDEDGDSDEYIYE